MRELEDELEKSKEQLSSSPKVIGDSQHNLSNESNVDKPLSLDFTEISYQSILAQTDLSVILISLKGVIEHSVDNYYNSCLENPSDTIVGKNAYHYFSKFPESTKALDEAIAGTKSKCTIYYNDKYISLSFTPYSDEKGNLRGVCLLTSDVTTEYREGAALRDKVQRLNSFNKDLEQFSYVASHDLHEPLRMVSNFLQLLDQEYGEKLDGEGKTYLNFAVDGASRMQKLLNNLLLYNRVGKQDLVLRMVNIRSIVDLKQIQLKSLIKSRNAKLVVGNLPKQLIAEPKQIGLIFYNLIENALIFNKQEEPLIYLDSKELEEEWMFSVKDNGVGIDYKNKDLVFSPFWSLNVEGKNDGPGIELAIVKKVVARHRGKVWFESEEGKGTIFYFTISKQLRQAN